MEDTLQEQNGPALSIRRFLIAASGIFGVWLLLTGSLQVQELVTGAAVAILTALISTPHLALLDGIRLSPSLPWQLLRFLAVFFHALVLANFDLARRVIAPSLPINPCTVTVRTALRSPLGRLLLANSITLTPGTLTVDVIDDTLLVHWIDISPGADIEHATAEIAARFERHLGPFLT